MVSITWKKIKGRKYAYISHSFRLPDGKVNTVTKRLKEGEETKNRKRVVEKYKEFFAEKEKDLHAKWAVENYRTGYVFSPEEIKKTEEMRVAYGYLIKRLDKVRLKDVFDRFTANFTYDSNAIEGSSLTLKDVAVIMFDKESVPNKPLREIYETRNSRLVVDMILKKKFKISHNDIIRMHRILMKDVDVRTGYKKIPNVIFRAEKEVHTAPPENVEKEMSKLIDWFHGSDLHPLEKAAIFHGRFEKIHPFEDGNGRVGRFLVNVILVNNSYPPLIIRKTTRQAYMSALMAFDTGYQDKLKRFFLGRFKDTFRKFFEIYIKYA
jgi:Fic family protein